MNVIKYWLPPLVWMGVIFFFSSRTKVEVSDVYAIQLVFFKTLHIIEYGILSILFYRALKNTGRRPKWQNFYLAWLLAMIYGMTDEIHQLFTPTREGRMRDVVIDGIGAGLTLFLLWKYIRKTQKKLKNWVKQLELM